MKTTCLTFCMLVLTTLATGQDFSKYFFSSKEYSKQLSEYRAKTYLIENILIGTSDVSLFEVDALAAAISGDLTTLVYKSKNEDKEGLILGFYGDYWSTQSGVTYQGYAFKHYEKIKALDFLNKLKKTITDNKDWLIEGTYENNAYIIYDDMKIVIYAVSYDMFKIRIHWERFDAEWDMAALNKTIKRLDKALKD